MILKTVKENYETLNWYVFDDYDVCNDLFIFYFQNLNALREACTLLENQLVEYENIHDAFETKQKSLNANTEKLISELAQAKEEIRQTKAAVNEERSLKICAETKCKRLAEDIECLKNECSSYKQQCVDFRQYSSNLTDELTSAEEKLTDYEVTIKSYERQISSMMMENKLLKEENSAQLTHLNDIKESNYQLGQQLTEYKVCAFVIFIFRKRILCSLYL